MKPGELERSLSHLAELARVAGVRLLRIERELSEVGAAITGSGGGVGPAVGAAERTSGAKTLQVEAVRK